MLASQSTNRDGVSVITAPYRCLGQTVHRICAGELISSSLRAVFPEKDDSALNPAAKFSGREGFLDYVSDLDQSTLKILVLAVEPHARGGPTLGLLFTAAEETAKRLRLRTVTVPDVQNLQLVGRLIEFGYQAQRDAEFSKILAV
jgi:hypothetical protein